MLKTVHLRALACMATIAAGIGCVAPYPYTSSPYGSYPGYYGSPGMMSPTPTLNAPTGSNTYSPTPLDSSANTGTSDAPMFDPDAPDPKAVPTYPDPGDLPPAKNDKDMFDTNQEPFGAIDVPKRNATNAAYENEFAATPAEPPILKLSGEAEAKPNATTEVAAEPFAADLGNADTGRADEFIAPKESFADADRLEMPYEEDKVQIPYGHDSEGYTYLRGLAIYDDQSETWSVIYNNKPGRDDQFGGVLTLVNDEGFGILNDNDVVQVSGSLSETERDEYGKAKYVVKELQKLQPIAK